MLSPPEARAISDVPADFVLDRPRVGPPPPPLRPPPPGPMITGGQPPPRQLPPPTPPGQPPPERRPPPGNPPPCDIRPPIASGAIRALRTVSALVNARSTRSSSRSNSV